MRKNEVKFGEIEKDVPLVIHKNTKYPFRDMQIGDSILLLTKSPNVVSYWRRATKFKFFASVRPEDGGDRCRVWRIK
jgi:hypothetical protein